MQLTMQRINGYGGDIEGNKKALEKLKKRRRRRNRRRKKDDNGDDGDAIAKQSIAI